MVIVKVLARHGPQVKPLAEVRSSIVKAIQAQRAEQGAFGGDAVDEPAVALQRLAGAVVAERRGERRAGALRQTGLGGRAADHRRVPKASACGACSS